MSILLKKGEKTYVNVNYMEAYIPEEYYEKGLVEVEGDKLKIFGTFNFAVGLEEGKLSSDVKLFAFPMFMITRPTLVERGNLTLFKNSKSNNYYIYKYYKGDVFIDDVNIVKGLDNTNKFIDLSNAGKLPNTIPYNKILEIYLNNLSLNDMDLGVSSKIIELKLSEIFRDGKQPDRPFRKAINEAGTTQLDYQQLNLRNIAMMSSTFSAMTFEDIDTMVINSINRKRYNRSEFESPVEKIIKY